MTDTNVPDRERLKVIIASFLPNKYDDYNKFRIITCRSTPMTDFVEATSISIFNPSSLVIVMQGTLLTFGTKQSVPVKMKNLESGSKDSSSNL